MLSEHSAVKAENKEGITEMSDLFTGQETEILYLLYYSTDLSGIPLVKQEGYTEKHESDQFLHTFFVKKGFSRVLVCDQIRLSVQTI